jgi:hypothetical protein
MLKGGTVVCAFALALWAAACSAQPGAPENLTVHPAMVKGGRSAPVTIIEFSDYQ